MAKIKKDLSTVKAVFNNLKSGTRKINEILQSIRGRKVDLVLRDLQFNNKRVSKEIIKTIKSAVANAENNLARQMGLQEQGLVSRKDVEAAQIKVQELKAKAASSLSAINDVSMSLSRQSIQTKVAPVDGTIIRLYSGGVSTFVKAGAVLGQFIPLNAKRSIRITVTGLDAPLVKKGAKARLQFEGWPVFQFSGWPGSSIGTFGGEVVYVEPVASTAGTFLSLIHISEPTGPY